MNKQANGWGVKPTSSTATEDLKKAVKAGKYKKMTFDIPEEWHQKFKIYAAQQNKTMAEILNTYIYETVNK
ncbi:MAG: hypothetical protein ACK5Z5_02080 [Neisseriaceae bacterium]|jgi:predicted HicB family RNase H-like nuclease